MKILKVLLVAALVTVSSAKAGESYDWRSDWRVWTGVGAAVVCTGGVVFGIVKYCFRKKQESLHIVHPSEKQRLLGDGKNSINHDEDVGRQAETPTALHSPVKRRSEDRGRHGDAGRVKKALFINAVPKNAPIEFRLNQDVADMLFSEGIHEDYARMGQENFAQTLTIFVAGPEKSDLPQIQKDEVSKTWLTLRYLHFVIGGYMNDTGIFPHGAYLSDESYEAAESPRDAFVLRLDKDVNIEESRRVAQIFAKLRHFGHQKIIDILEETV